MPKSQLTWEATWTEPITMAALTERLYEEGAGKEDLVALLKDRDRELVEKYCGPRYHPPEGARYGRSGTRERTRLGRWLGIISITVHQVHDTQTDEYFVPLWDDVLLDGQVVGRDRLMAPLSGAIHRPPPGLMYLLTASP